MISQDHFSQKNFKKDIDHVWKWIQELYGTTAKDRS